MDGCLPELHLSVTFAGEQPASRSVFACLLHLTIKPTPKRAGIRANVEEPEPKTLFCLGEESLDFGPSLAINKQRSGDHQQPAVSGFRLDQEPGP